MVQAAFSPAGPTLGDAIPGFGTDGIRGRVGSVVTVSYTHLTLPTIYSV